jgi:RNA polymerase sigma-70 factor (ECF subfamily)
LTDDILIKRSQAGDNHAFNELVKRYEPRIAATVFGMLGDCPETDDVGQETFIRFYHHIRQFRGDSSVATYLTRIAINLSLNEMKRRRLHLRFFQRQSETETDLADNSNPHTNSENRELIQRALQKLAPNFRSVLVLRLVDGYSTKETAEILKLPMGTVLSRLARAQQKMKELLKPYLGD